MPPSSVDGKRARAGSGGYADGGSFGPQKRIAWSPEEDKLLIELVERHGQHNWPEVAHDMPGRTSKSCSLRWRCFLNPALKRPGDEPLSEWEIAVIVEGQKSYGNRWTLIASLLPGRCNNDIKNYYNLYLKAQIPAGQVTNKYLSRKMSLQELLRDAPDDILERERAAAQQAQASRTPLANIKANMHPNLPQPAALQNIYSAAGIPVTTPPPFADGTIGSGEVAPGGDAHSGHGVLAPTGAHNQDVKNLICLPITLPGGPPIVSTAVGQVTTVTTHGGALGLASGSEALWATQFNHPSLLANNGSCQDVMVGSHNLPLQLQNLVVGRQPVPDTRVPEMQQQQQKQVLSLRAPLPVLTAQPTGVQVARGALPDFPVECSVGYPQPLPGQAGDERKFQPASACATAYTQLRVQSAPALAPRPELGSTFTGRGLGFPGSCSPGNSVPAKRYRSDPGFRDCSDPGTLATRCFNGRTGDASARADPSLCMDSMPLTLLQHGTLSLSSNLPQQLGSSDRLPPMQQQQQQQQQEQQQQQQQQQLWSAPVDLLQRHAQLPNSISTHYPALGSVPGIAGSTKGTVQHHTNRAASFTAGLNLAQFAQHSWLPNSAQFAHGHGGPGNLGRTQSMPVAAHPQFSVQVPTSTGGGPIFAASMAGIESFMTRRPSDSASAPCQSPLEEALMMNQAWLGVESDWQAGGTNWIPPALCADGANPGESCLAVGMPMMPEQCGIGSDGFPHAMAATLGSVTHGILQTAQPSSECASASPLSCSPVGPSGDGAQAERSRPQTAGGSVAAGNRSMDGYQQTHMVVRRPGQRSLADLGFGQIHAIGHGPPKLGPRVAASAESQPLVCGVGASDSPAMGSAAMGGPSLRSTPTLAASTAAESPRLKGVVGDSNCHMAAHKMPDLELMTTSDIGTDHDGALDLPLLGTTAGTGGCSSDMLGQWLIGRTSTIAQQPAAAANEPTMGLMEPSFDDMLAEMMPPRTQGACLSSFLGGDESHLCSTQGGHHAIEQYLVPDIAHA